MSRPIRALIDGAALTHNLDEVRRLAPHSRMMAVVKANAYGHGIELIAQCLATSADAFAVASVDEALVLRHLGVRQPVVLLEGIFAADELDDVVAHGLEVVIHSHEQIAMLQRMQGKANLTLWIKIDTGMHRLGFSPSEVISVWQSLMDLQCTALPIGLMTHFANSDVTEDEANQQQLNQFSQVITQLPGARVSMANSAAIVHLPDSHHQWIRPGIMMYGVSPSASISAQALNLLPVMTLVTRVIAVKQVNTGEFVGYGGCWQAQNPSLIAIVAAGYGDGYPRHVPSGTPVLINGQVAPIVGRVSMDMMAVDISHLSRVVVGDPVVLWGKGLAIEQIAAAANTISYELLCGVTKRVPAVMCSADEQWYQPSEFSYAMH